LNFLFIATTVLSLSVTGVSNYLFQLANSLAGRSWILDSLIALPVDNELVKAGVIGCCFMAAWFSRKDPADTHRVRRILLITLIASAFVIVTTKAISKTVFLPRPFIQSQKLYHLEGDSLVENQRLAYRVPLDKSGQESYRDLLNGDLQTNDLGSFPSDHAGFYVTVAAGIWLASRSAGLIALAWTFLVILAGRVITGMHSPLDIAAGSIIGLVELLACQYLLRGRPGQVLDRVVSWTEQQMALSSALLFIVLFEISSTLTHIRPLLKMVVDIGKHLLGRGV